MLCTCVQLYAFIFAYIVILKVRHSFEKIDRGTFDLE